MLIKEDLKVTLMSLDYLDTSRLIAGQKFNETETYLLCL
jgi:hypothetical protein